MRAHASPALRSAGARVVAPGPNGDEGEHEQPGHVRALRLPAERGPGRQRPHDQRVAQRAADHQAIGRVGRPSGERQRDEERRVAKANDEGAAPHERQDRQRGAGGRGPQSPGQRPGAQGGDRQVGGQVEGQAEARAEARAPGERAHRFEGGGLRIRGEAHAQELVWVPSRRAVRREQLLAREVLGAQILLIERLAQKDRPPEHEERQGQQQRQREPRTSCRRELGAAVRRYPVHARSLLRLLARRIQLSSAGRDNFPVSKLPAAAPDLSPPSPCGASSTAARPLSTRHQEATHEEAIREPIRDGWSCCGASAEIVW